jgi:hypothetical protein
MGAHDLGQASEVAESGDIGQLPFDGPPVPFFEDGRQQPFLAAEVLQQGGVGDADPVGDRADRAPGVTVLAEDRDGGRDDLLPPADPGPVGTPDRGPGATRHDTHPLTRDVTQTLPIGHGCNQGDLAGEVWSPAPVRAWVWHPATVLRRRRSTTPETSRASTARRLVDYCQPTPTITGRAAMLDQMTTLLDMVHRDRGPTQGNTHD